MKPVIFISYSHQDELWQKRLVVFLEALGGEVEVWGDHRIGAGMSWRAEIEAAMDRATIAVLMVTANFLTSKFILNEEVPRLLKRRAAGTIEIVPIIVLACPWQRIGWLSALQCRPENGVPLALRKDGTERPVPEVDANLNTIVEEIARMAERPRSVPAPETILPAAPADTEIAKAEKEASSVIRQLTRTAAEADATDVLAEFKSSFLETSKNIDSITRLKEIHDELHTLERDAFAGIQNDFDRTENDAAARERLTDCAGILQAAVAQIRAIARFVLVLPGGQGWLDKLERAHSILVEAIAARSASRAATAVSLLTRVLDTEPDLLNEQIVARTNDLDLIPVQTALKAVQKRFDGAAGNSTPEQREKVKAQINSLSSLGEEFLKLVNEHNDWQHVENDLRSIEASLGGNLDALETIWPIVRKQARPLFTDIASNTALTGEGSRPGNVDLHNACEALGQQMAGQNPSAGEVRRCFRLFRRLCAARFFQIDLELKDACDRLSRLGESFELLLRMLDSTSP